MSERTEAYEQAAKWCEKRATEMEARALELDAPLAMRTRDNASWVRACAYTIRKRAAQELDTVASVPDSWMSKREIDGSLP